jgi:hypothetical protein
MNDHAIGDAQLFPPTDFVIGKNFHPHTGGVELPPGGTNHA